ncbi:DUF2017 domain-containing protein [Arthrobacter frigidicola]|nr:DUF2017 domain-containing protein [Arthrobacter frigidicola]
MAKPFKSTRRGITGHFEPGEVRLLGSLFSDIITMLEPDTAPSTDPLAAMVGVDAEAVRPGDSALQRLLPDAVRDDDAEALEFRRLTERSLREQKIGALRSSALLIENNPVTLNPEQGRLMVQAFNDVRLVLADRLGIETDEDAARLHGIDDFADAEDVEAYLALVYNFLTWLQESLLQALLSSTRTAR